MGNAGWTASFPSMTPRPIEPGGSGERPRRVGVDSAGRATIELESHPTGGYRWHLVDPSHSIVVEKHELKPGESFGGAARETFRVRLASDVPAEVEIVLKRPWEKEAVEVRKLVIGNFGAEDEESEASQ